MMGSLTMAIDRLPLWHLALWQATQLAENVSQLCLPFLACLHLASVLLCTNISSCLLLQAKQARSHVNGVSNSSFP